jgi:glucose-6-phosphate isomerase
MNDTERFVIVGGGFAGVTLAQRLERSLPPRMEVIVPHRFFEGSRSSNVILVDRLTPEVLGKLVALYEHRVFTQGVIWNIDSFDQWGVELGKVLAQRIVPVLESQTAPRFKHDSSTNTLIRHYRKMNRSKEK